MNTDQLSKDGQTAAAWHQPLPAKNLLDEYINSIQHLPPTPSLMIKLLEAFRQPDPDIAEVAQLIRRDPALSAEVLKRCNSAAITGEQPVADMFEAISRLGFYEVYCMVGMVSGSRVMALQSAKAVVLVERLSRHSTMTATAASIIARRVGEPMVAAFTAGLLHDIGKIVFAAAEGAKYSTLLTQAEARGETNSQTERNHFGFNHSEVGARLLNRWALPQDIVNAVFFHDNFDAAGVSRRLAATVALSSAIANGETKAPINISPNATKAAATLNLDAAVITEIIAEMVKEIEARKN